MKDYRWFLSLAGLALVLLVANPGLQAAKRKARPAQKEHAALAPQPNDFQKHVEQEIASLKEDVYTRATWKKVREVQQQADETAGKVRMVTWVAGIIGFVVGCVVTFLFARRMGGSEEQLKIT